MKFDKKVIIETYYTLFLILVVLNLIFEVEFFSLREDIMIVDKLNFSYIEYISDLKLIPEELEKKIDFFNNNKYNKLSLFIFNKNIYCECFNNKNETIIFKEIKICNFYNCELKIDKSNNKNYNIYK